MRSTFRRLPLVLLSLAAAAVAADDPVFRSEVALSRVDARVIDRYGHTVTGLIARDFVLRLDGKEVAIRNFANESTPIDILLLLDVSGSMEPHVERIATAAEQALQVLGDNDRVAIMVFDSRTRVRLPFRGDRGEVTHALDRLLRAESFNGGTRITSALLSAARYVEKEARPDARHAIVILTDDQTQDDADEGLVESALRNAGAILSFLQAPYEETSSYGIPGGGMPGGGIPGGRGRRRGPWGSGGGGTGTGWPGGGWPGGSGPIGFPGGGGGRGYPMGDRSHSAGTDTIAHDSGGDTMQVQDAAALEDTLSRLRQRYALYFYLPEGMTPSNIGNLQIGMSEAASLRYHGSEIESRRVFMAGVNSSRAMVEPASVTKVDVPPAPPVNRSVPVSGPNRTVRRSRAVNEGSGPNVNSMGPGPDEGPTAGTSESETSETEANHPAPPAKQKGGWPRATEKPNQ